jgi:hypothetical protein
VSTWRWDDARPEQEWTLLMAAVAFTPHALALANIRGWMGDQGAILNQLSSIYFLACPVTLALAACALVRSRRTMSDFSRAGRRERACAIAAFALSAPTLIASGLLFLMIGTYAISGGGR